MMVAASEACNQQPAGGRRWRVAGGDLVYARAGDVHVAYRVFGEGPATLLLVPDGLVTIESIPEEPHFARFVDQLAAFTRVVAFDRRGVGLSDPVSALNPPTLEHWADDAVAVMDDLEVGRAWVLGMAEGGFVVTMLAASRPSRVAGLILLNCTPGISSPVLAEQGLARGELEGLSASMARHWGDNVSAIPQFAPSLATDPEYREWLRRTLRRAVSPGTARLMFDVQFRSDLSAILPLVNAPTLVIHRSDNQYLPPAHGHYLASAIPNARYVEVPGRDHVPYVGDTAPVIAAISEFLVGVVPPPAAERVLATVLITDIVGSTRVASRLGDQAWRRVLDDHDAMVRGCLSRFRGTEVKQTGDGFLATVDGPARGISCASAILGGARDLGIEARAGLHTGELELRGRDVGGLAVHIAARVAELASPGEVLVSRTVTDLVAGSGLEFEDRGEHELKGVPGSWRLFALVA